MNTINLQRVCRTGVLAAVLILPAGTLQAATTGQLSGWVVDSDGAPLLGVSVSASSPTQIGGAWSTETDLQGWFQYPRLNPGFFSVRLALDGFLTQELTEVQVRLDRMTQVHVTMPLATFGEEVTVTETTPVVDPQRVSTGQTFTSDFIQETAVGMNARFFYGQIVLQAAGTSSTGPGGESGGGGAVSVLGSTGSENIYQVDGLDISNPYWGGVGLLLPLDSIHEVAFESGGFRAEFGRGTGGVINALTKSGSNVFSGTFDARYSDNGMASSGEHYDPDEQTTTERIVGATLGGRLLRDRAWFFASLENQRWEFTPSGAPTTVDVTHYQGFLKVTGQASPSWLALGKYYSNPYEGLDLGSSPFRAAEATIRRDDEWSILQAEVSGVLSQSLLWELQVGSHLGEEDYGPMSGDSEPIQHRNLVTGMVSGNELEMFRRDTGRDQVGTYLTWFVDDALGGHEIKLGGEYFETSLDRQGCWTGLIGGGFCRPGVQGFYFRDRVDAASEAIPYVMTVRTENEPSEVTGTLPSLHVQDSWRVRPDVTLQLGLRWDRSVFDDDLGETVADTDLLQPRLGAAWDLTRNGRNLLRASWGRFMNSGFLRLPRQVINLVPTYGDWVSCSFVGLADPTVCAEIAASEGRDWRADPEGWDPAGWWLRLAYGGPGEIRIAPDLEPTYSDTLIVGFERELLRRTSLELSYVDKATRNVLEDTCRENYPTVTPGECSGFVITNVPEARRDYTAWILNFESRAVNRLHVLASYTHSDAKGGLDSGQPTSADFDLYPQHFENRYGYLRYHRKNRIKASGYVYLPLDFGLGFSGVWGSPFRWTPSVPASLTDPDVWWGDIFLEPRGSREGDEWAHLDLQLTKGFSFGRARLRLIGAVLNLFDSENATEVCDSLTGCGEFEMGEALSWQQPRRYELGVRVEF